jgi:hypothetical protein
MRENFCEEHFTESDDFELNATASCVYLGRFILNSCINGTILILMECSKILELMNGI